VHNEPYEDTDTLVLTSTNSGFIDIRFPLQRELGKPIASDPSFWAFSGTSSTTFIEKNGIEMPYSAHCVWKHDIDTKGPGITDEGDMFVLANGDSMEVGLMQNPNNGKVEMYKEYWTSPAAESTSPLMPCVVARIKETPAEPQTPADATQTGSGGLIIRIGGYCQGIMRQLPAEGDGQSGQGEAILVERWTTTSVAAQDNGSSTTAAGEQIQTATASAWVQDWRSNTPSDTGVTIPCRWAVDDDRKLGDEIMVKGKTWTIVEKVTSPA
jgi:hypothetical protein